MTSVTTHGQLDPSIDAELIIQDLSHADRHDIGVLHTTASGAWYGGLNSGIYRDNSLYLKYHDHSYLAALLMPQIPHRLKNLTLSGSSGPPFWELANTSPQGPHLPLPAICDHFTEGMTGILTVIASTYPSSMTAHTRGSSDLSVVHQDVPELCLSASIIPPSALSRMSRDL
ncbi:hypothetical protein ARMGADRAFT_1163556 [Armillaria gallica]|uniref:Uncharacterized protein n=1 Tax=Armillaria gallica TaxID=47427 RepID=A0A2H3DP34_ARMGA|nr:hypothetical protein ARMGADRAFT_1163556 [Armillaria gallica]